MLLDVEKVMGLQDRATSLQSCSIRRYTLTASAGTLSQRLQHTSRQTAACKDTTGSANGATRLAVVHQAARAPQKHALHQHGGATQSAKGRRHLNSGFGHMTATHLLHEYATCGTETVILTPTRNI